MDDEQKKDIAVFRFGVISDLVTASGLSPGEKKRLIGEKCGRKWTIPHSEKTRLSKSTILRWAKKYQDAKGRLESLYPKSRLDDGQSRAIGHEIGVILIEWKKLYPEYSIKLLIETIREKGVLGPEVQFSLSAIYRFFHAQGLMDKSPKPVDRRKFEAELPNDLWQSDVMHGPMVIVELKKKKAYLFVFLDDHSRFIPYGRFHFSENTENCLKAFESAILKYGLPRKLYVDNGACYRSKHLETTCASLGVALILARPYTPQGKGKSERFIRTVRTRFLPLFEGETLEELNLAFEKWLNEDYHNQVHSATGQTPRKRFTAHAHCLRQPPDNIKDYFRKVARRKVAKDRTVSFQGRLYQAPTALIDKQVNLLYHPDALDKIEIRLGQESFGFLEPVDLAANCRVKRTRDQTLEIDEKNDSENYKGGSLFGQGGDNNE